MPKIRYINPSDPGIIDLAKKFNVEHKRIYLLRVLKLACKNDKQARKLLEEEPILQYGARQIRSKEINDLGVTYLDYLHAVALAQRRLQWDGDELLQLKRLIKENYSQERWIDVEKSFTDIGDNLWAKNEEYEKNFFNYAVDKLIYIYSEKKQSFKEGVRNNDTQIDIGEIDSEITSGKNGFITDADTADKICDLFFEAASTPWKS